MVKWKQPMAAHRSYCRSQHHLDSTHQWLLRPRKVTAWPLCFQRVRLLGPLVGGSCTLESFQRRNQHGHCPRAVCIDEKGRLTWGGVLGKELRPRGDCSIPHPYTVFPQDPHGAQRCTHMSSRDAHRSCTGYSSYYCPVLQMCKQARTSKLPRVTQLLTTALASEPSFLTSPGLLSSALLTL